MVPFTRKYAPKKIEDVIGNEKAKNIVRKWFLDWIRKKKQKPLLIYGPPGIGKTSLVYAAAAECGFEVIELSSSDFRDWRHLSHVLKYANTSTLSGKPRLILLDDIDAISTEDRGAITTIARMIEKIDAPLILTANDAWNKKLSPLRVHVSLVEMKKVAPTEILHLLKKIVEMEGLRISEEQLKEIAQKSEGDVRAAINDLQAMTTGYRDRKFDIFLILSRLFKARSLGAARMALAQTDVDHDTLKLWLDENIPIEYEKLIDIAKAYDYLSRADVFDGRIISRQYWGFLRYSSFFMAAVGVAKSQIYRKFTRYSFPNWLRALASRREVFAMKKEIAKKLASKLHLSSKAILQDFLFYARIAINNKTKAKTFYRLTEEEIAFLEKQLLLSKTRR